MIRAAIILLACLVGFSADAAPNRQRATDNIWMQVATTGDDAGDCISSPCRTIQYAADRAMQDQDLAGHQVYIKLAPGRYVGGARVYGQPVGAYIINIVGQQSNDPAQSCPLEQASQVIVEGAPGQIIFDTQDYGLTVIRCLTVRATCIVGSDDDGTCTQRAAGVAGFKYRQTVVSDIAYVKFDVLAAGISTTEHGAVNLGGVIWLSNNMTSFLAADTQSRITIAAPVVVLNPVNIPYFAMAYQGAHINFYGNAGLYNSGWVNTTGARVWRGGTIIANTFTLPGGCIQADPNQPGNCW